MLYQHITLLCLHHTKPAGRSDFEGSILVAKANQTQNGEGAWEFHLLTQESHKTGIVPSPLT
jgi:hypothetical protein